MAKTALAFSIMPDSPIEKIVEWTRDAEEMGYAAVFMDSALGRVGLCRLSFRAFSAFRRYARPPHSGSGCASGVHRRSDFAATGLCSAKTWEGDCYGYESYRRMRLRGH
jgi:hypothetical protein